MTCEKCVRIRTKYRRLILRLLDENKWRKFSEEKPKVGEIVFIYDETKETGPFKIRKARYFIDDAGQEHWAVMDDYIWDIESFEWWRPDIKPPKKGD
jgi:hypothetical protein